MERLVISLRNRVVSASGVSSRPSGVSPRISALSGRKEAGGFSSASGETPINLIKLRSKFLIRVLNYPLRDNSP